MNDPMIDGLTEQQVKELSKATEADIQNLLADFSKKYGITEFWVSVFMLRAVTRTLLTKLDEDEIEKVFLTELNGLRKERSQLN